MSRLLAPLVPLYSAAVSAKNAAYTRGWTRPKRLGWPVISIGNLSVGGSGKTPLTIRLAVLLRERCLAVDVLSRGYGRKSKAVARVDPNGSADEFGDEPLLIAREAGVPVFVGGSRHAAGLLAEARSAVRGVHLLDDGFQHRQLGRNVDIVVVHRTDFEEGLLPAGRLRERLGALQRAHVLALREEDRGLEETLRRRGLQQPIWWMGRRLEIPHVRRAVAFCAIARPGEFFSGLKGQGVAVAGTRSWRDHHAFTRTDVLELMELQRQQEADAFLTTAKDLVRLSGDQRCALEKAALIHAVPLRVRLSDEGAAIDAMLSLLPGLWRAGGDRLSQTP